MEYAYATCILNESGEEINETNLTAVLEAAGCVVQESRVKALVAALEDIEIDSAVNFDDLGADPNVAQTTDAPSEPAEADLTDASGMDLMPSKPGDGFDGASATNGQAEAKAGATAGTPDDSGATNGAVESEAGGPENGPDDSGATNGAVDTGANGPESGPNDDPWGLDELFDEKANGAAETPDGADGSSDAAVDWDAMTASSEANSETESDEV